jgi:hypothetical protein
VYSAKINGEATTFGTSGLLYRSNKLMYDRVTQTLWNSFLGEPVIGQLANSGIRLDYFPVVTTTWEAWSSEHPDTTVLSTETGLYPASSYAPESSPASLYFDYREDPESRFPVWNRDDRLATKDEVLGLSIGQQDKAYPVDLLKAERIVNDSVGGSDVVIVASSSSSAARVYERSGQEFSLPGGGVPVGLPASLIDAGGTEWRVTEEALVNTDDTSETLERIYSQISFWFGWFAFHPDTQVHTSDRG